ncbi:MAG TPA: hypothetical protein GX707_00290 [Epulopiscium sp.]|nr:hypothetical protein [Candidatus Epulonipiscium sp.]
MLNTPVTEELIANEKADVIIVATGSKPLMPNIKGIDGPNVVTAEFIASTSFFPVYILEMQPTILSDMVMQNKIPLMELLTKRNVQTITNAKVSEITKDIITCKQRVVMSFLIIDLLNLYQPFKSRR